jgi:two-component system chemotaxis response regulator CheY
MKTILLVDDSPTLLLSMSAVLTGAGYTVVQAKCGADALAHVNGTVKPDLVLTDLNMPDMDGIAVIKALRKLTKCRFTPILMLTTESRQVKRDEAKAAGATGWLVKPVAAAELLGVLGDLLPGAR